ncbi:MAG TPA: AMP-binding protein [Solirubrobacteraceae bacterium]|nr:AMP-binding protein [Solirubrobacteraceae bacterium]
MSELVASVVGRPRASVPELWEAQVAAGPDRPFLRWEGREWTYAEAWAQIGGMAALLADAGVGPGDRVATFVSNRPEALWTWFGAQLCGAVHVAINREHRGDLLADMLRRSRATLMTEASALADLPPGCVDSVLVAEQLDVEPVEPPAGAGRRAAAPADLASVMYTSGTTGRSKAVLLCHNHLARGGARFAESIEQRATDRWHAWMPMSHIFGQLHVTMATVAAGGSLALYPRFSQSRFWEQIDDDRCTIFGGLGNMLRMLWHAGDRDAHRDNPLRVGLIATPPPELRQPFIDHFDVELVDSYGMTEAEPVTIPVRRMPPTSCGAENPDFELAVLDEDGERVPDGELGELAIRPRVPDVMFRGYEGDDAATVQAWRNLWFHTGDVGRRDPDGFYYLVDRRKHVIRTRGENVSPSELESLLRAHPAVRDCGAVGVAADGVDDDIKVVVVAESGAAIEPADLHAWCAGRMAAFMIPSQIELRAELPYSELGKVDREALREAKSSVWSAA